jgi:hypothetical protein
MPSAVSPRRTLEALDGARGGGAEDAVGRDAEAPLRDAHVRAAPLHARAPAAPGARAALRTLEGAPRRGADDAVGLEAAAALEAHDRTLRALAERPVGAEAEQALELLDDLSAIAALERALGQRRGGRHEEREGDGEYPDGA